jgi:glycolate oxidase
VVDTSIHKRLQKILGGSGLLTNSEDLLPYSRDASGNSSLPSVVLLPKTTEDIRQIVQLAHDERLPLAVRGGGTGLDGGAVARNDGILLSVSRMDRILEVSPENMLAVVQPGVNANRLNEQLQDLHLFYPVDPASWRHSTIGGDVATRAHAFRGIKYGPIGNYLLGLEAVISPGDLIRCGANTLKCATGYHLVDLFAGSGGRIGIITQITLKLLPEPSARETWAVALKHLDLALRLRERLEKSGLSPSRLELLDPRATRLGFAGLIPPVQADSFLLLVELDGPASFFRERSVQAGDLLRGHGTILSSPDGSKDPEERWWRHREDLLSKLTAQTNPALLLTVLLPVSQTASFRIRSETVIQSASCCGSFFGHLGEGRWHLLVSSDNGQQGSADVLRRLCRDLHEVTASCHGQLLRPYAFGFRPSGSLIPRPDSGQEKIWRALKTRFDPLDLFRSLD